LGVFNLSFFKGSKKDVNTQNMGFFSALLFGVVFSIGWTPCVGAFLGTALSLAAQQAHVLEGMIMLLIYSLGLAIPFIVSALLIDYLKNAFNWIKKHYKVINVISGVFLIIIGFLMAIGKFEQLVGLFI
jgi:cytochrome c-type biogenesis protein